MSHCKHLLALVVCGLGAPVSAQTFRASFDDGTKADHADGRALPWVSKGVETVAGKFGKAVRLAPGSQLAFAAERNFPVGRGTLAFWCKVPELPGPADIQRLIFIQCKERGYWNYLASIEWQEGAFRAMMFDYYHGHGIHDPEGLPAFKADTWHHVALVWDQSQGVKLHLDGQPAGSTWGKQAWWDRPSPHAIHLTYPGATYDELNFYDRPLADVEVSRLAAKNEWKLASMPTPLNGLSRNRLNASLGAVGLEDLPVVEASAKPTHEVVVRQAVPKRVLDDRIPSWKVMDGRMDLFWPEWRAPTLGDVDFSGSEISIALEKGEKPTHLVLRGLAGGCQVHGERDGYVSRQTIVEVPLGVRHVAVSKLPANLTGLRLPASPTSAKGKGAEMKLQEIGLYAVESRKLATDPTARTTALGGEIDLDTLGPLGHQLRTRTASHERRTFGEARESPRKTLEISGLSRVHFLTNSVDEATPLDALALRIKFLAAWKEDVWWLRVQDPVNPRRDLIHVPIRVVNSSPGKEVTLAVALDFWDIMLDKEARLWVELMPTQDTALVVGGKESGHLALRTGPAKKVLAEFAHTQIQLAFSYWQLGSEANGTQGSNAEVPSFNLLGGITSNYELKITLEWVRRHVPDNRLANNLWRITHEKRLPAPVKPRLQPAGAPEWAVWGRELLERFRSMSHKWADWQGPDGQLGGGWNDDTDFPGVFICLPLLGDTRTQKMFERIYDGVEKTGYMHNSVSRAPIDTLHATDFLSWRAHLILFDYGEPRHIERALALNRELFKWTRLDKSGHRRAITNHYSEDGPERRPRSVVDDDGRVSQQRDFEDGSIAPFLRDLIFCAWYSRNPAVMKFLRESAEGDYARAVKGLPQGYAANYAFYSYATLFGETKYIDDPVDKLLRDRWSTPIWRRFAERLPKGDRHDAQLLKGAKAATATDETLTAAYLATRDKAYLVRAARQACEQLEGGWQFRGGEARGANDHFNVNGQASLAQMYLGSAVTWLRPATIVPPIAVSWQGIDTDVAALVLEAKPTKLRVAVYNFDPKPRTVRMRVWELESGKYALRQGDDGDQDDKIDGKPASRELALRRGSWVELTLPSQKTQIIELDLVQKMPRPDLLPDLAVGQGDVYYDKATDRLKVVVHNIGAAAAKNVIVRFEDPASNLLAKRTIPLLDAPLDLHAKTAIVWMPQPLLHPLEAIHVRIDPANEIEEITEENNVIVWRR